MLHLQLPDDVDDRNRKDVEMPTGLTSAAFAQPPVSNQIKSMLQSSDLSYQRYAFCDSHHCAARLAVVSFQEELQRQSQNILVRHDK